MTSPYNNQTSSPGATWRALLIGLLLIPLNVHWLTKSIYGYPTTASLYFNVIFCLFILTVVNMGVAKLKPRSALKQGELITVYVMLSIASSLAGLDMLRVLIPLIPHAFWYASPENEWAALFHHHVPDWIAIKDTNFLAAYYEGGTTLYLREHVLGWITPAMIWSGFLLVLVFAMICINSLVRKQWTEREKLSYPIIQLPLEMTYGGGMRGILTSRVMWIGFFLAAGMNVMNGINFLVPAVPRFGGHLYYLHTLFTNPPWNAIGWTPVRFLPFAVGLAFFIPLDLSFSSWFFFLFWKAQRIIGAALGMRSIPGFPFIDEQSLGAYVGLFIIAMIGTRRHFRQVIRKIFTNAPEIDDSQEPMPYRFAAIGLFASFLALLGFCKAAGMSVWVIVLFFTVYYIISTSITRMRAELGSPVHDLHFIGPDEMLPRVLGTRRLGPRNLTMFAYFFSFNRAYRSHPMPHQLEGFKLAERTGIDNRRLVWGMILAAIVGILASFWSFLHISYKEGARDWFAWHTFNRLQNWLVNPSSPNYPASIAMLVGLTTTLFLMIMRMRMFWWPFHPAGYAISGSWSMNVFWFSIFISSIAKWIIMKHGGLQTHRKAVPFFLGLILGEFFVGSLWGLIGISTGRPMYRFF